MQIDDSLISYLEDLSYLTLGDEEKKRIAGDLEKIIGGLERLNELDTSSVPERSHPFDNVNAYREDLVSGSFDREMILMNAPERNAEMFIVPKTVE